MNLNSGDVTSLRPSGKGAPQPAQGPLTNMSLPDAIKEVLEDAGRALSKKEVTEALRAGGKDGSSFPTQVSNTLQRLQERKIINVGEDGRWFLTAS